VCPITREPRCQAAGGPFGRLGQAMHGNGAALGAEDKRMEPGEGVRLPIHSPANLRAVRRRNLGWRSSVVGPESWLAPGAGRLPKSLRRKTKVLDRMNRMNRIARSEKNASAILDPSTSRDRDSPLYPVDPVHPVKNACLPGQRTWSTVLAPGGGHDTPGLTRIPVRRSLGDA